MWSGPTTLGKGCRQLYAKDDSNGRYLLFTKVHTAILIQNSFFKFQHFNVVVWFDQGAPNGGTNYLLPFRILAMGLG